MNEIKKKYEFNISNKLKELFPTFNVYFTKWIYNHIAYIFLIILIFYI